MKKPILGILAVCVMQMTFIAYTALEKPIDTAAMPVDDASHTELPLMGLDDKISVYRSASQAGTNQAPKPSFTAPPKIAKPAYRALFTKQPIRPKPTVAIKTGKGRTEYPIVSAIYPATGLSDPARTKPSRKRSFLNRAVAIIKKPYDWTKSALEKLN